MMTRTASIPSHSLLRRSAGSLTTATALALAALACLGSRHALAQPQAAPVVMVEEVPFIVSPDNVTLEMLRIASVGPTDHVIDLGSGDGRIVTTAAKRFGATGLGVEIDPTLVEKSRKIAAEAGVGDKVEFRIQDLFTTDLSKATVITMYLLPDFNMRLRPAILALKPGTRIVSHDWDMGDWKPDQTVVLPVPNKQVGREKSSKVHFWTVPAQVAGVWCGAGPLASYSLRLAQNFQEVTGTLQRRERSWPITGRMQGPTLATEETAVGSLVLERDGQALRLAGGKGAVALAKGTSFTAAKGSDCGRGGKA
jgi:hypothetical protein